MILNFSAGPCIFKKFWFFIAVNAKIGWLDNVDGVDLVKCFLASYRSAGLESFCQPLGRVSH